MNTAQTLLIRFNFKKKSEKKHTLGFILVFLVFELFG